MTLSEAGQQIPGTLDALVLVRHGESMGNVADAQARKAGAGHLDLDTRDPDTPLSERGVRQAMVLAQHVAQTEARRPDVVLSSPYMRAASTARIVAQAIGMQPTWDERLRERDLGVFDGLTGSGIRASYPEEAERRSRLGKFYYRPPGGESWTDVALRVRQVLLDLALTHSGRSVWVFSHQAVIMSFRLALEGLDETTLLDLDRSQPLANCSLTRYRGRPGTPLELESFADVRHLEDAAVEETHEPTATEPSTPRERRQAGA
ncbi:phosphoglycerate mutase [Terrabacter sp. Soil811]|uniref:histidine phosphatase family protein n=1 Tax=Terrabacter sp. Soil811 TaxID=1736419 RepID=UPI0006FFE80B|nr:histidine phosphatase family protein [Terrabacter sp. Soil811]KRF41985.1 phosphoglycerate mutase [Terrabacter sp. Soil811]